MPYQLVVTLSVATDPKYARYLRESEVVSGVPFQITFRVKNVGEGFPGGKVKRMELAGVLGMRELVQWSTGDVTIPKLEKGQEHEFISPEFTPLIDGLYQVRFAIETESGERIQYYQSEGGVVAGEERYTDTLNAVDRSTLEILHVLEKIRGGKQNE